MRIHTPLLIASLLLSQPVLAEPVTIPAETAKLMKRGKKLGLVWAAPGFDGAKGFRLGKLSNESEDEAGVVLEYLPTALSKQIKGDSPYSLQMAVVAARMKTHKNGSSARVEVEGKLLDQGGALVAAFTAYATETIGGNERDNARQALRTIAFAMAKDLFPSALPTNEKSPAVIMPAPTQLPAQVAPAIVPPVQESASSTQVPLKEAAPMTSAIHQQPTPTIASPAQPTSPLIPATIAAGMKPGQALSQFWTSFAYDRTKGFSLGEVRYQVESRNDGIDKYLPEALAKISKPDAPCQLHLVITELATRTPGRGISSASLGVEGILVAADGTLLAAFRTRESVTGIGDLVDDCRTAARQVVLAIVKDLQ